MRETLRCSASLIEDEDGDLALLILELVFFHRRTLSEEGRVRGGFKYPLYFVVDNSAPSTLLDSLVLVGEWTFISPICSISTDPVL